MAKTVKIGIMGTGWPGRSHTEAFGKISGAKVVAVSDVDADRRAAFVKQFGKMAEYADYKEMLKNKDLDAVVIALPTGMHYNVTKESFAAGMHVLCEKPPTATAGEMEELAKQAADKGLVYSFCRQPRFNPNPLEAKRLVEKGTLGDIYMAESAWIRCRNIPFGAGGWFVNKAKGGGVLLDLGIHVIDNAWFVMGCPKPVEVMCGMYCAFSDLAPEGVQYDAEDGVMGMIRFENGAMLRFMTSFALNAGGHGVGSAEGVIKPEWGEVRLFGTKAGIDVNAGKLLEGKGKDGVKVKPLKPKTKLPPFVLQGKSFINAIRDGGEPANSASQAVMLMQMLEALRTSGETKRAVQIG